VSRSRALIEAYALTPDRQREAPQRGGLAEPASEEGEGNAIVQALDFLDSCVLPFTEQDPSRYTGPAEDTVGPTTVDGPTTVEVPDSTAAAASSAPRAREQALPPKHSAWRVPRGLIYWLSIGAAASTMWRQSSSLLQVAIAALVASALVIVLELALRMINPRIARRLGLARGQSDAAMYGAGAVLGLVAGIAIVYLV
jgi:uncharacterized protein YjeT (DUF2065 family)